MIEKKSAEIVLLEVASGQTGNNKVINKTLYEFMERTHWKMTIFHSRTFLLGSLQSGISDFRRLLLLYGVSGCTCDIVYCN